MEQPVDDDAAARLRLTGERIDTLLDACGSGGVVARERAEELVRVVTDLYGAGLERLLDLVHGAGHLDDDLLASIAADDLVASLLLVHGLHPYDVTQRVEHALEQVRPYLGSHGGDVELLGVGEDGVVRLRLLGSCDGCPSSSVTLSLAVQDAVEAAAPEVTGIEVEEPPAPAAPSGLIAVDALWSRVAGSAADAATTWHPLPGVDAMVAGAVATLDVVGTPIVVCRVGDDLVAYADRCARCGSTLHGASLSRRLGAAVGEAVLRCPAC